MIARTTGRRRASERMRLSTPLPRRLRCGSVQRSRLSPKIIRCMSKGMPRCHRSGGSPPGTYTPSARGGTSHDLGMRRRALSACPLSRLRAPTYAEPVDASVAAAAIATVVVRRGARMPTWTSLGGFFWYIRVATSVRGSRCGIKSGIETESAIVELTRACQAKLSATLKQTGETRSTKV